MYAGPVMDLASSLSDLPAGGQVRAVATKPQCGLALLKYISVQRGIMLHNDVRMTMHASLSAWRSKVAPLLFVCDSHRSIMHSFNFMHCIVNVGPMMATQSKKDTRSPES
jgi:hypothetical protein